MKTVNIFVIVLLNAVMLLSCSQDDMQQGEKQEVSKDTNYFELVTEASEEVHLLEQKIGQSIKKNEFEVGQIKSNVFVLEDGNSLLLLKKYYNLLSLKSGHNVSIQDFSLVDAKSNNGYDMLVAEGVCEETSKRFKLAYNLIVTNEVYRLDGSGSGLMCAGCRRGCNPKRDSAGDGYCTDCKINNSSCIKTETL